MRGNAPELAPKTLEASDKVPLGPPSPVRVGRVRGWGYFVSLEVAPSGFRVYRRDIAYDQVEEQLGIAYSLEEAKIMAQVEIERTRRSLARRGRPCPPFDWNRWGRKFGVRQNSECRGLFSDYVTSDLI